MRVREGLEHKEASFNSKSVEMLELWGLWCGPVFLALINPANLWVSKLPNKTELQTAPAFYFK